MLGFAAVFALAFAALVMLPSASADTIVFEDDFNDGTVDSTKWPSHSGASETDTCGASSEPYSLYFREKNSRHATTRPLGVSDGGEVQFDLKFASSTSDWSCTNQYDRDVMLQYSTAGTSWTTIQTYDDAVFTTWTTFNVPLPAAAHSTQTQLRWIQEDQRAGQKWMIDDVTVFAADGNGGEDVTVAPGDQGTSVDVPAQETPAVPSKDISTPPVETPPTCDVDPCTESTTLVPGQDASTPSQTIPGQCTPFGTLCFDDIVVEEQSVSTDPVEAPPACEPGSAVCLGPVTVLPGQDESTPSVPSQEVTPPASFAVEVADTSAEAHDVGAFTPIGPTDVTVDTPLTEPITVTVCANPSPACQQPVQPTFSGHTELHLFVQVGEDSFSETVPVDVN